MRIRRPLERWFPCVDDPDEGEVLIKHLSPGELQDIEDEEMPQRINYEPDDKGNMIPQFSIAPDRKHARERRLVLSVKGWRNFFDEDGNPIEHSDENVIRASREIDGFNEFVADCRKKLAEDVKKDEAGQEKN
jgi:hypothetical protein